MGGLWWGFALNIIGTVTGAAVAFFIARKLGRNWVQRRFLRHRRWAILDEAIALAERIAKNAPLAVRTSKDVMKKSRELSEEESWALNGDAFGMIGRSADAA